MVDTPVSEFDASHAQSDDNVLAILSSSRVTVLVVDERMWYGPRLWGRKYEYEPVSSPLAAATANASDLNGPNVQA